MSPGKSSLLYAPLLMILGLVPAGAESNQGADLTYQHQAWEFDDTVIIDDLDFSGPMLGAVYNF